MRINKIENINFGNNKNNVKNTDSQNAILMLRDPNASIKFQHNQEFAQNADSVSTNPFKALGYKLYRTFNMIRDNEPAQTEQKSFSAVA